MDERKRDRERAEDVASDLEKIDLFRLLHEFWQAFRRLFWIPVVLVVLCSAFFAFRAWWGYTPMYQSEVTFTIQTGTSESGDFSSSTYYDKATAEQMTKTFPHIISSELLQDMLRQELGGEPLNGTVTAHTVENTNLFSLVATSNDPQAAYDMLTAVMEVYPQVADYVIGSTNMHILTEPVVADEPYNDLSILRPMAKGILLGGVLGLAVVLLYAVTRKSIQDPKEVRNRLNQTCLGTLPQVSFKRRSKEVEHTISIQNEKVGSEFQESVRRLRMKFLRETEQSPAQILMVTSTLPGEGKTTVACNLALSLRKPSVKKSLRVLGESKGVGYLLEKGGDPRNHLIGVEESALRLLADDEAAGSIRKKSVVRKLNAILENLRQEADYIILDTPPSGLLADSGAVAHVADGIIYVVRSGIAQLSHILDSLQFLGESGTKIIGCVLNGGQGNHGGYGYYGYGYRYGYGTYGGYGKSRKGKNHVGDVTMQEEEND